MSTSSARSDVLTRRPDRRLAALGVAAHAAAAALLLAGGVPPVLALAATLALAASAAAWMRHSRQPLTLEVRRHRSTCRLRTAGADTAATLRRTLWCSAWLVGLELQVGPRRRQVWLARPWMSAPDLRRLRLWLLSVPPEPRA